MRKLLSVGAAAALTIGLGTAAVPLAQAASFDYTIELLANSSSAESINDAGDVVSGGRLWRSGNRSQFVTMDDADFVSTAGVSNNGVVAGFSWSPDYAWIWQNGKKTVLPKDAGQVNDISANGTVLTGKGALWTSPTTNRRLPTKGAGATFTGWEATGISPNARQVVASSFNSGISTPLIWTDTKLRPLGKPSGVSDLRPEAVNDAGVAVGASKVPNTRPVIWDSKGKPSFLPQLPGLQYQSPQAINNSGEIVGITHKANQEMGSEHGLLWKDGKVFNLDDMVDTPADSKIVEANDINASGQIVGKIRIGKSSWKGFVATPRKIDVYTTPGTHHVNGRNWKTTCEKYSQTTRCRTDIIATEVKLVNGKYTHVKGWTFNNLTYLPSPRALWKGNPLATPGNHTVAGRQWRTECDTPVTGRNGCRSYILATKIKATPKGDGAYTYTQSNEWVFNNIVMFS